MTPRSLLACSLALAPLVSACSRGGGEDTDADTDTSTGASTGTTGEGVKYRATIRRTGYGVAHVLADDVPSATFGQGYAFAQDHVCTLADQIVKVRSERSKYFGPGPGDANLTSDFAYLSLGVVERASAAFAATPEEVRAAIEGYAAGYNKYVRETPSGELPPACAGAPWVREIAALDLVAYYIDLGLLGSGYQLLGYIGTAQPPGSPLKIPARPLADLDLRRRELGSNGWALGKDRSASGAGQVVANPHFPWEGELKLWESHLRVPGELDIYGVGLMGVPGVLIGFNEQIAWTHTFSYGNHFVLYKLDLAPGDPTSYLYDGEPRKMTSRTFEIEVAGQGEVSRTMWYSHYGPMLNVDPLVWSDTLAITYRDANIDNPRLIEQFLGMDRARSLAEFKQVFARVQGIPWVNTMAADRAGNVWYADASAAPRLSEAAIAGWQQKLEDEEFFTSLLYQQGGLVLLDGSDSTYEWVDSGTARAPGLVPFDEAPQLDRDDFVFNANDSYWLANPKAPLTGYSPMHGPEGAPQSPRTRMNALLLSGTGEGSAAGEDGKFTVDELQAAIQGNQSLVADLLVDDLVARCKARRKIEVEGSFVDLGAACTLLAEWDRRYDPASVGAVIFREFLGSFSAAALQDRGVLFNVAFNPKDPIGTPHTLVPPPKTDAVDGVLVGLGKAVRRLYDAGIPLSAPLAQVQRAPRGGVEVGVHGGLGREGVANVVGFDRFKSTLEPGVERGEVLSGETGLTARGYVINFGASFVMAVELTKEGPQGQAFLSYGQSEDPRSRHFRDQTVDLFAKKQWRALLYREEDIAADPALRETVIESDE